MTFPALERDLRQDVAELVRYATGIDRRDWNAAMGHTLHRITNQAIKQQSDG